MSRKKGFDFLESVYMPVVVCTEKGRIVSRNRYADVITSLPGNGLSIEAAAEPEMPGAQGIRFRRLRAGSEAFRTALLLPVYSESGDEYVGWLFDVAFQLADEARLQAMLGAYRGFSLAANSDVDAERSNRAAFRRFCGSVYPALLGTAVGHRVTDVRFACRSLLYSLRQILEGFGCRTELSLPDSFEYGRGVDYSLLILSMIHLLIFVMSKSEAGRLKACGTTEGGRIRFGLEVPYSGSAEGRGGFAELEKLFPGCAAMISIISAAFAGREDDFSFECGNGRLCVRFSQETFEYSPRSLRQRHTETDISALFVFAAAILACTKKRN